MCNVFSQVQIQLFSHLAAECCVGPLGTSGLVLRDMAGVEQLLFSLREHYSVVGEKEKGKVKEVRSYLLLVLKQFITTVSVVEITKYTLYNFCNDHRIRVSGKKSYRVFSTISPQFLRQVRYFKCSHCIFPLSIVCDQLAK